MRSNEMRRRPATGWLTAVAVPVVVAVTATLGIGSSLEPDPPVAPTEVVAVLGLVLESPERPNAPTPRDTPQAMATPASPITPSPSASPDGEPAVVEEAPDVVERGTVQHVGGNWLADRQAAAMEYITWPWQDLGFSIVFHGPRDGLRGMTFSRERRIEIYARPDERAVQTASDLAHEIGHAIDLVHGTEKRRTKWYDLRGIDRTTPWFACDGCRDFASGAGDFAEVFAYWQIGDPGMFHSEVAGVPSESQMHRLIPLMRPAPPPSPESPQSEPPPTEAEEDDGGIIGCWLNC